jgi:hypothetical protein
LLVLFRALHAESDGKEEGWKRYSKSAALLSKPPIDAASATVLAAAVEEEEAANSVL